MKHKYLGLLRRCCFIFWIYTLHLRQNTYKHLGNKPGRQNPCLDQWRFPQMKIRMGPILRRNGPNHKLPDRQPTQALVPIPVASLLNQLLANKQKSSRLWSKCLGPYINKGGSDQAPDPWLSAQPNAGRGSLWAVNKQVGDNCFSCSIQSFQILNFKKKNQ